MLAPLVKCASYFCFIVFGSLSKIGYSQVCGLISGSSVQFHWSFYLFLCQYQAVFSTVALAVEFEVRDCDASRSFFIVQNCGYPGFFASPYEVECCSFEVCEEFCWDFDGYCIEFVDCFW